MTSLLVVAFGVSTGVTAANAAVPHPRLTVSRHAARPGASVRFTGTGLPGAAVFTVQICGDNGRGGSLSCDLRDAQTSTSSPEGGLVVAVRVAKPPAACPCVISVLSTSLERQLAIPFVVIGAKTAAPSAEPRPPAYSHLVVQSASLRGGSSLGSWFGVGMRRTLYLTVANTGTGSALSPPIVLTLTPTFGSAVTLASPVLGAVPAQRTRTFAIPVQIGALSAGHYRLNATIGYAGQDTSFTASTNVVPWGLIIALATVGQLGLLAIRNRVRRRLTDRRNQVEEPHDVTPIRTNGVTTEVTVP